MAYHGGWKIPGPGPQNLAEPGDEPPSFEEIEVLLDEAAPGL